MGWGETFRRGLVCKALRLVYHPNSSLESNKQGWGEAWAEGLVGEGLAREVREAEGDGLPRAEGHEGEHRERHVVLEYPLHA